jgi:hypothetical protein
MPRELSEVDQVPWTGCARLVLRASVAGIAFAVTAHAAAEPCARQIGKSDAVRIAEERARAVGCLEPGMRVDADPLNTLWNSYRMGFVNTNPTPPFLKNHPPDRPYWAIHLGPPQSDPPRTDGDLFIFVDGCDGSVLGEMRWCGQVDRRSRQVR